MGVPIKLRVASSQEAITLQSASGSLAVEAVSPRVSFEKVEGGTRLDITDVDGTKSAILPDGAMGPIGPTGATGPAGIGIVSCELLQDYRLMITYSNGVYDIVGPIRGPQGEIGPIGPSGTQGPSGIGIVYCELLPDYRLQITYSNGTYDIVGPIRGPQGEAGNDGSPGADGTTFTPSVSSEGVLSWTNDGGKTNPLSVNIKGPKGDPGDDYVLTAQDKSDIAGMVNVTGKADKVSGAVTGNFASLDANGNLTDSGSKASDFLTEHQDISGKQDALTFDSAPTSGSTNPVTSGGVYTALQAKADPVTVETISGMDPVITGADNHRYVCGTCDTLTLTPPSSGIVDVVFTSGTTPTVLSVPSTVKWPGWFNPSALDASTTYELNITDGVYGAVMAWT